LRSTSSYPPAALKILQSANFQKSTLNKRPGNTSDINDINNTSESIVVKNEDWDMQPFE
jgi:hypothetical protein